MAESYTVFWPQLRCRRMLLHGMAGARLTVLFGGPHLSQPSFQRAGVRDGDLVYPVSVFAGVLHILGRMRVAQITPLAPERDGTLEAFLGRHPQWRWLPSTGTTEMVLGEEGTALRLDVAVPPDLLGRLRYRSSRRERPIHHIEAGRLVHTLGIQGIYRLSEPSAGEVAALLERTPAGLAAGRWPPGRPRPPRVHPDQLSLLAPP